MALSVLFVRNTVDLTNNMLHNNSIQSKHSKLQCTWYKKHIGRMFINLPYQKNLKLVNFLISHLHIVTLKIILDF